MFQEIYAFKLLKYTVLPLRLFVALLVAVSIEHSLGYKDNSGKGSKVFRNFDT
jgi:hypothetical protein